MSNKPTHQPTRPENIPIKVGWEAGMGHPTVVLGDLDITRHLSANGGIKVEIVDYPDLGRQFPQVTLVFAADAMDVDIDVSLVEYVRSLETTEAAR